MNPFIGEIRAFGFGQIPQGWAPCAGQLLSIAQNQTLFALLGVRYGGNGVTDFALPDLRGRSPVGFGQVEGGVHLPLGTAQGSETVALTSQQVPPHTHAVLGTATVATTNVPSEAALAQANDPEYGPPGTASLNEFTVSISGAGAGHPNMQPSLVVSWCIATVGLNPPPN